MICILRLPFMAYSKLGAKNCKFICLYGWNLQIFFATLFAVIRIEIWIFVHICNLICRSLAAILRLVLYP